ncbi:MAG: glycosyl transferase [Symploca sp. SIO2B6]|nr:glycosyl transferase [Symploca sp. SIO2B6]
MITVILGTSPYPFHRAIAWLHRLLQDKTIDESVFVQSGVTDTSAIDHYPLIHTASIIGSNKLVEMVTQSRMVISHAGQGSTQMLVAQGASFVLMPRLAHHREHVDDHQLLFAQATQEFGVNYCLQFEELKRAMICPPLPLPSRQLFEGPKLADYLCQVYSGQPALVS